MFKGMYSTVLHGNPPQSYGASGVLPDTAERVLP